MALKYNVWQSSNVAILDLNGRLSLGEALAFGPGSGVVLSDTIRELTKKGQKKILLNLAEVTYVDSSGLAVLIEAMQNVRGYGGHFGVVGLQEPVRTVFEIARLDQVFQIYPTLDGALVT